MQGMTFKIHNCISGGEWIEGGCVSYCKLNSNCMEHLRKQDEFLVYN
jgi:hypothetical protein